MAEKNIDAEIKKKHAEFDKELMDYLNQFRMRSSPAVSPIIQQLRQKAMISRTPLGLQQPKQTLLR